MLLAEKRKFIHEMRKKKDREVTKLRATVLVVFENGKHGKDLRMIQTKFREDHSKVKAVIKDVLDIASRK